MIYFYAILCKNQIMVLPAQLLSSKASFFFFSPGTCAEGAAPCVYRPEA